MPKTLIARCSSPKYVIIVSPRPKEDALEGVEIGAGVCEAGQEACAIGLKEAVVEIRRHPLLVIDEQGAFDPFHHLVSRCQMMPVDLQPHVLLSVPQAV